MSVKVSMVCPTYNRPQFLPTAIRSFLQQEYAEKELIIVDDGDVSILHLIPPDPRIRYIRAHDRTPTGTKRNIGAEAATGEIIAALDDDDWSSAHRLFDQVQRLLKTGKAVTGYNQTITYDVETREFYLNGGGPPYFASGTSQCYLKSWWRNHPFPDATYGEDSAFSRMARLSDQLAIAPVGKMMAARRHEGNTDAVNLGRLTKLRPHESPLQALDAMQPSPSLHNFYVPHVCNPTCHAEAEAQYNAPIVEYHVDWLPEITLR